MTPSTPHPHGTGSGNLAAGEALFSVALHGIFMLSGISALLYEIIWQRALMLIYGTNTESVAMVVSAFLVGLGLGSLAGGALSKRPGIQIVGLFSGAELVIGLYGLTSLQLFQWVGQRTAMAGTLATGLLAFGLVLVPTLLMGATLPLLVACRVRDTASVGRSVSWLYGANTLGAALGALLGTFVVLGHFGLAGATRCAAGLNLTVALVALALTWTGRSAR